MSGKLKNLDDLFEHQIKDLYSAESQLIKALPKMAAAAHDPKLKALFEKHLTETENQLSRIEELAKALDIDPKGETCKAMKGLIEEGQGMISEDAEPEVKDAGLIAEAQRIEHYEISGYGTARYYAQILGHKKAQSLLEATLAEEQGADTKLNDLAKSRIDVAAM